MIKGVCIFTQALDRVEQKLNKLPESEQYNKKRQELIKIKAYLEEQIRYKNAQKSV